MKPLFIAFWLSVGILLERSFWDWNHPLNWNVVFDRLLGIWAMALALWIARKMNKGVES